jgi:hypothetical protein
MESVPSGRICDLWACREAAVIRLFSRSSRNYSRSSAVGVVVDFGDTDDVAHVVDDRERRVDLAGEMSIVCVTVNQQSPRRLSTMRPAGVLFLENPLARR